MVIVDRSDYRTLCVGCYHVEWSADQETNSQEYLRFIHKQGCNETLTMYVAPESVPASHGYKSSTLFSIHEQFGRHNSRPATPKNQSGDGSIIDTNETK